MTAPITTAELMQADFSAHTPMMQQYLGLTIRAFACKALDVTVLAAVPS